MPGILFADCQELVSADKRFEEAAEAACQINRVLRIE
jgi:hypothetical protein